MSLKPAGKYDPEKSTEQDNIPCRLTEIDKQLLNDFQHMFPMSRNPYKDIAAKTGISEEEVLNRLRFFKEEGIISRIGPVIRANTIGTSTLAAMAIPDDVLEDVATLVNSYTGVNHNYEREGKYNLWFVVTAKDEEHLAGVISDVEKQTGFEVLNLPMLADYHIDLGFDLQWNE